jgi:uracil-DNA glycosylase
LKDRPGNCLTGKSIVLLLDLGYGRELLPRILNYPPSIKELPMAFFNLVGCMPKNDGGRKRGEPLPTEIAACWPRLDLFFKICKPELVVAVGDLSEKQSRLQQWDKFARITAVVHPAFILREDITRQGLTHQRSIAILSDAFSDILENAKQVSIRP